MSLKRLVRNTLLSIPIIAGLNMPAYSQEKDSASVSQKIEQNNSFDYLIGTTNLYPKDQTMQSIFENYWGVSANMHKKLFPLEKERELKDKFYFGLEGIYAGGHAGNEYVEAKFRNKIISIQPRFHDNFGEKINYQISFGPALNVSDFSARVKENNPKTGNMEWKDWSSERYYQIGWEANLSVNFPLFKGLDLMIIAGVGQFKSDDTTPDLSYTKLGTGFKF